MIASAEPTETITAEEQLAAIPQWINWRYDTRGGKVTKPPSTPRGTDLDVTNPAGWMTIEDARAAYEANKGKLAGIGFVFTREIGLTGIDLDDSYDRETGELAPWAQKIVDDLNTYCQISPSQTGVKLTVFGLKPEVNRDRTDKDPGCTPVCKRQIKSAGNKIGEIEMYDCARYFTWTGEHLSGTPLSINANQPAIDRIYQAMKDRTIGQDAPAATVPNIPPIEQRAPLFDDEDDDGLMSTVNVASSDSEIIERVRRSKQSAKFDRMFSGGDATDCGGDVSRADSSLASILAFYTKDAAQIERIMGEAAICVRDKWTSRADYRQQTIAKALALVTGLARPERKKRTPRRERIAAGNDDDEIHDPRSNPEDEARLTELANTEELDRQYGENFRWNTDRGVWMFWTGKVWDFDTSGAAPRAAKAIARGTLARLGDVNTSYDKIVTFAQSSESSRGINAMLKLWQSEPGKARRGDDFNTDDFLLNVENGTIELKDGDAKLRPHCREDYQTVCLSTSYNPNARAPLWAKFLHRVMGGNLDMIAYLQRLAGVCLTGTGSVQELFIPYGLGGNGKSVFFDTLVGLLEGYAGVAPESLLIAKGNTSEHPTEIADLQGKRMVVASETEDNAVLRLQLVKRLTGDARLKARFMRQDFFEFRRTHKLILCTNNRPKLTEDTVAVWRRLRIIPFDIVIPDSEKDPHLIEKLKAEYAGILAWAVRGCIEWQQNGMQPPAAVLVATDEYRADADELGDFLAAKCVVGDGELYRASRDDLITAYLAWAKAAGVKDALDRKGLYNALRKRAGIKEVPWKDSNGKKVRGFSGLQVMHSMEESYANSY